MIAPKRVYEYLLEKGISFFSGVPDSVLKPFLHYLHNHAPDPGHVITSNEGLAIGIATGYHLATEKIPFVYLQNSGLGNMINPITSLAGKDMYSIPMLLMIGWRGQPGKKDEPQHTRMGAITIPLLDLLDIPYYVLKGNEQDLDIISEAIQKATTGSQPVALLVGEGIFEAYEVENSIGSYSLVRENVLDKIIGACEGDEAVVCTTGKSGREFYELNKKAGGKINKLFLNAGAMGHANHIALGLNMFKDDRIIIIDGDGALLMHMGSLPTIAQHARKDYIHIAINNGSHESVGGQPTPAFSMELCEVASACGYPAVVKIEDEISLTQWLSKGFKKAGVQFVEIRTNKHSRTTLERPEGDPGEWKKSFQEALRKKK
jgi:phosphonopyruvate decarboxylase